MIQDVSIHWEEGGQPCSAVWHSENGIAVHKKVVTADDTLTADDAYHLACEGTAILWKGDFQNARQLLQAIEQDEKETQEKVNKIKAEERKQKADENRRRNRDW